MKQLFTLILLILTISGFSQSTPFTTYDEGTTVRNDSTAGVVSFASDVFTLEVYTYMPFVTYQFGEETHFFEGTYDVTHCKVIYNTGEEEILLGEDLPFFGVSVDTYKVDSTTVHSVILSGKFESVFLKAN